MIQKWKERAVKVAEKDIEIHFSDCSLFFGEMKRIGMQDK